jgi:hypothetical protein
MMERSGWIVDVPRPLEAFRTVTFESDRRLLVVTLVER